MSACAFPRAILVTALVMSLLGYGINYGIDFAGGLNIQYDMGAAFNQPMWKRFCAIRASASSPFLPPAPRDMWCRSACPRSAAMRKSRTCKNGLEAELSQIYPDMDTETATASYVGPVAGATLVRNAVISVLLAAVLMLAYIALRFDFASGLAAVIGPAARRAHHDRLHGDSAQRDSDEFVLHRGHADHRRPIPSTIPSSSSTAFARTTKSPRMPA